MDLLLTIFPIFILTLALLFSKKMIQSNDSFKNFIGLLLMGMVFSSYLGTLSLVFGFIPVLLNSLAITYILRGRNELSR